MLAISTEIKLPLEDFFDSLNVIVLEKDMMQIEVILSVQSDYSVQIVLFINILNICYFCLTASVSHYKVKLKNSKFILTKCYEITMLLFFL